jgi:gliding motility-associated-like protein
MKPILTVLFLSFCLFHKATAQSLISRWQYAWGGDRQEFLANMIPLPGNQYLFGGTSASNPSCTKSGTLYGGEDIGIFVLDDNNNKLWEKSYGGNNDDQLYEIAKVPAGGYIMAGVTQSGPSGIKTSPAYGSMDIWVIRIDDKGNLLWERTFGGPEYERGQKVIPTPDGGFLIAGMTLGASPGYTYGSGDYFVMKIDASGNQLWKKNYGGSSDDELEDILPLPNGNYLLSGFSSSPADGNKTAPSLGGNDNWLICIRPDGTMVWDKTYGSSGEDAGGKLLALQDGNYLLTSYTLPGTGVIRKIDGQGNEQWVRTCVGQGAFNLSVQNSNGDIYVGGNSAGSGGCKTSPLIGGGDDIWVAVYDASGNKIGDMDFGGDDVDLITDIRLVNGELWIMAWSDSYKNGNKTVDRCGQSADGWIIRLTHQLYIQSPTPTDLCSNSTNFDVDFTAYNIYQAGNVFTAQLSDAKGSFATYTNIGMLTDVTSGTIPVTLPPGLPASDHYRLRVVAALPADTTFGYPLSIHGLPAVFLGNDTTICDNLPLTLSPGPQSPGTTFQWNDGSTGSALTVSSAATWSVDVKNSCGTIHDDIDITTRSIPTADIGDDRDFCEGTTLTLQSTGQPPDVSYIWNTGALTASININVGGSYWLHAMNTCGFTEDAIVVTMKPRPVSQLDRNSLLCEGTTRELDPGQGFAGYLWNDGQGGETRTISAPGQYWVQITGANNCVTRDTATITRIVPLPAAFLPKDTSLCAYEDLTLRPRTSFRQYEWSTGEISPSIHITHPGLYALQVTDRNGCIGSDDILVSAKQCPYGFFMPNAFTPNHDGHNDLCHPLIYGKVGKFYFCIYDRWGVKVFGSTDHTRGWDGYINGHAAEAGAFVWYCSYQLGDAPEQFAKGTVTLVR